MSENEIALAALEALGVKGYDPRDLEDRVHAAYRKLIPKTGGPVTCAAVARELKLKPTTVRAACVRLVEVGRMVTMDRSGGKFYYIPAKGKP